MMMMVVVTGRISSGGARVGVMFRSFSHSASHLMMLQTTLAWFYMEEGDDPLFPHPKL